MYASKSVRGYSLLEMILVAVIGIIISAAALLSFITTKKYSQSEAALQMTLGQMRQAHRMAVDKKQVYCLRFVGINTIELDLATCATSSVVSSVNLPLGFQFYADTHLPTSAPDSFGVGAHAVDFDVDYGGSGTQVLFQPNGTALDSLGRVNNGVVYVGRPNDLLSSRAVSLYGATGKIKGWHLYGNNTSPWWGL